MESLLFILILAIATFVILMPGLSDKQAEAEVKGRQGERLVRSTFSRYLNSQTYIGFHDLIIPFRNTTTQIDHVYVSIFGIFVLETKNYSGWIFGGEKQVKWTQTLNRNTKHSFPNPVRQNDTHVKALSELLKLPRKAFHSVIVFTEDCQFKTKMPPYVCHPKQAAEYIRQQFKTPVLTGQQVEAITTALSTGKYDSTPEKLRAHTKNLNHKQPNKKTPISSFPSKPETPSPAKPQGYLKVPPALLLVRPAERINADAELCRRAGWQPVPFPLIRLSAKPDALAALPAQLQQAAAVVWISPSSVETALPAFSGSLSRLVQTHIAVGNGTARSLRQAGCPHIITPEHGHDSEAVLALPLWQQLESGAPVLIVRGQNGRDLLPNSLRQRGFQVACADIYRRLPIKPDWPLYRAARPDAAWITSSEQVRLLFAAAPISLTQPLKSLLYFTHHPRIAEALHQAGAQNIRLLNTAAELENALIAERQQLENQPNTQL